MRRGERSDRCEDFLDPCLVPRLARAGSRNQRLKTFGIAASVNREDGPRRPPPEILQGEIGVQPPEPGALRQPRARDVAPDGAAFLHAAQDAKGQGTHHRRLHIAQRPELLPDAQVGVAARLFQGVPVHADRRGARPLQGAADGRPVAELGQGVPAEPLRDELRQPGTGRQPALLSQLHEIAQPQPVGGDELADEPLGVESIGVDRRVTPPGLHLRGEIVQRDAVVAFDDLRDC